MQTLTRHFYVPETEEDHKFLSKQPHLTKRTPTILGRMYTFFTEKDTDELLIYDLARSLQNKYSYEAMYIRGSTTKEVLEVIDTHKYDIVIDIRTEIEHEGLNGSELKNELFKSNLSYKWMPQLSQKENAKLGYNTVQELAKQYRRFMFIGNNKKRLDKVCERLHKLTTIYLLGTKQ